MKRSVAIALLLLGACSSSSSCAAPKLTPSYLPHGLRSTSMPKLVESERSIAWSDGTRTVYVLTKPSANLGDGTTPATVRGRTAEVGETGIPDAPLAVEWHDRCGANYAVLTKGLSERETLRVANGLRPDG